MSKAKGNFCCPGDTRFFLLLALLLVSTSRFSILEPQWHLEPLLPLVSVGLAEPCISPGASFQARSQWQKTRVPLTDAITLRSSVMAVIGIGVIKPFSDSCCLWIGVNIPQCIQHSPVVFWSNGCGVIPCLPKVSAASRKTVQSHG